MRLILNLVIKNSLIDSPFCLLPLPQRSLYSTDLELAYLLIPIILVSIYLVINFTSDDLTQTVIIILLSRFKSMNNPIISNS
jgi:hypothetical protein